MIQLNGQYYPDVFLAGVPKSGTTYLFDILSHHPRIQPSVPKETYFHLDKANPFYPRNFDTSKKSYADFFDKGMQGDLHMDGSPINLYQEELVHKLNGLPEKPKSIIVLREPARRILSSFLFTSNNLSGVDGMSFSEYAAYLLEGDSISIAKFCKNDKVAFSLQNELNFSKYVLYLREWQKAVGSENLKLVSFEKLRLNPEKEVSEICGFLGLNEFDFQSLEGNQNTTAEIKNKFIHYYLYKAFQMVGYNVPFKSFLKKIYFTVQNMSTITAKTDYKEDLEKLSASLTPHNIQLAKEFDFDITSWK